MKNHEISSKNYENLLDLDLYVLDLLPTPRSCAPVAAPLRLIAGSPASSRSMRVRVHTQLGQHVCLLQIDSFAATSKSHEMHE